MFNEILVGRINRYVQKLLQIKNTALRNLEPGLTTVLPLFVGVEDRYLQGWNRFAMTAFPGAVAAQTAGVRLRNPVGSNLITVIERITAFSATADQPRFLYAISNTDFASITTITNARLDARSNPQPSTIMSSGSVAGPSGNALYQGTFGANGNFDFILNVDQELTLLPGDTITVFSNVVNQGINVAFMWRERTLESSELT